MPCTGDGTTRKHPEVFHRWEVALALRQHPLQLQIAMRGAALLRVLKLPEEKRALERLELQGDAACEECLRNNLPDLSRVAADVIGDSLNASILSTLSEA